mgnify:CR=1 FL=1
MSVRTFIYIEKDLSTSSLTSWYINAPFLYRQNDRNNIFPFQSINPILLEQVLEAMDNPEGLDTQFFRNAKGC